MMKKTIADAMNKHFVKIIKKLKLKTAETETGKLTLSEILDRYNDHQSIVKTQSQMNDENNFFSLKPVMSEEVLKTICSLKTRKNHKVTLSKSK